MIGTAAVVLYLSAALQGVVLAAVILKRRIDAAYQLLLGVLVMVFSLYLAEFAAYWTKFYLTFPNLLFATGSFPLLFGPLIYGFVSETTGRRTGSWRWLLPHLIPFGIYLVRLVPFYMASAEFKRDYFLTVIFTSDPHWSVGTYIVVAAMLIHLGIYLTASWTRLQRWSASSDCRDSVVYRLLSRFLAAWGIILVLRLANLLEIALLGYRYIVVVDHSLLLFSSLLIYSSVYMMLGSGYEYVFGALRPPSEKYARSTLEQARAAEIAKRAQVIMGRERLFLDPELRLETLARRLGESRYHVSQSLNQQLGKTYYEFVNEYRIRELKDRMNDPETAGLPILQLALEAGFGTKATFNTAFKKATGLTPSQYRAQSAARQ